MSVRRGLRVRPLLRGLVALLTTGTVLLTVSACQVKPGAAAFVGNEKISESDLNGYLSGDASGSTASGSTNPRTLVLSSLVRQKIWTDYLTANGGVPDDATLAKSRDEALIQAFQSGTAPDDQQLVAALEQVGLTASFAPVFTRESELLYTVVSGITKGDASSNADVAKIVTDAVPKVRISPRYGTWDTSTLNLADATPNYLQLSGGTSTTGA